MALVPPETLSPSKVSSFKDCALAFRFSAIDRLPEAPSVAATRGTLVHLALEHLFEREPTPTRTWTGPSPRSAPTRSSSASILTPTPSSPSSPRPAV